MSSLLYIAHRMNTGGTDKSRPAIRVATAAAALSVMVMVITLAVVVGFKREIRNKVIGFDAHIQVVNYDNNNTYDMQPLRFDSLLLAEISSLPGVRSVSRFATKPGILKTDDDVEAVIFKGVSSDYNWDFFSRNLVEGALPLMQDETDSNYGGQAETAKRKNGKVIISTTLARMLRLSTGDDFLCYFVGDKVRARKFHITGLYNTDFQDYDKMFIIGDIGVVQRLNNWDSGQVSGIEILTNDFGRLQQTTASIQHLVSNRFDADLNAYFVQNAVMTNQQIFAWLDLLDVNVVVIIVLMLIVTGFALISALLILILDAIKNIGTLKALGATNRQVSQIFIYQASVILLRGLLIGNIIGIALCALQYYLHLIPLDPVSYYVNFVPVSFTWGYWLALNTGTIALTMLVMTVPTRVISSISPARVLRYE